MSRFHAIRQIGLAAVLILGFCTPALAQSERIEMGWDGNTGYSEHRTRSSDHPLQYYLSTRRQDEYLRAQTDNCAFENCKDVSVDVSNEEIGAPFGKKIFQILYTLKNKSQDAGGDPSGGSYWKSILAESSPGIFREIFLLKNEGGFWSWPPSTTDMVSAGDTKLLFTNDSTTSRGMWCTGAFWVLEKSGPIPVDFLAVNRAIDRALPPGTTAITPLCAAVNFEKREAHFLVQEKKADCRACGFDGSVTVKFKFEGSHVVATSASFLRDAGN